MNPRPLRLLALGAACTALTAAAAPDQTGAAGVLANTSIETPGGTLFSPEGFRKMTLKGTEARLVNADRTDFVDMNIAVYSGDAASRLDSVILSPSASFFLHEYRASGDGPVRLIDYSRNFEVTGEKWVYEYGQKKISIARNVRVIIHAALPDMLK
jgi:hypothetical protein